VGSADADELTLLKSELEKLKAEVTALKMKLNTDNK
jgi:hypothetical protein